MIYLFYIQLLLFAAFIVGIIKLMIHVKAFKVMYLYFIVFPTAICFGLWIAFLTLIDHIIDQFKIKY